MPRRLVIPPQVADSWEHDTLILERRFGYITEMAFSNGDEYLATCSEDGTLLVWEVATHACTIGMPEQRCDSPSHISFLQNSTYLAAAYVDHGCSQKQIAISVVRYDPKTGSTIEEVECFRAASLSWPIIQLAFASCSRRLTA
jgi:WD40 repeat protein